MKIAVVGADFKARSDIAKFLAAKNKLPFIEEMPRTEGFNTILRNNNGYKLRGALDIQIRKQILYKNGFISAGCTLDYIAITKIMMEMYHKDGREGVPQLFRARLHTVRQMEKIIYIPLIKEHGNEQLKKYDTYLRAELDLLSEIVEIGERKRLLKADEA